MVLVYGLFFKDVESIDTVIGDSNDRSRLFTKSTFAVLNGVSPAYNTGGTKPAWQLNPGKWLVSAINGDWIYVIAKNKHKVWVHRKYVSSFEKR